MNTPWQQWLEEHAESPDLLACGIRLSNGTCFHGASSDAFTPEGLSSAWEQLAALAQHLEERELNSQGLCLAFEKHQVHFVTRPDGTALGAITPRLPAAETTAPIAQLFAEFQALA